MKKEKVSLFNEKPSLLLLYCNVFSYIARIFNELFNLFCCVICLDAQCFCWNITWALIVGSKFLNESSILLKHPMQLSPSILNLYIFFLQFIDVSANLAPSLEGKVKSFFD